MGLVISLVTATNYQKFPIVTATNYQKFVA